MVSVFEPEERVERSFAMMETLRLVVTQALVPRKDGKGRVGVREYMGFDEDSREHLLSTPLEKWTFEIQRLLPERGRSMQQSANFLLMMA